MPLVTPSTLKEYSGILPLLKMRRDPLNYFVRMMGERGAYASFTIAGRPVIFLNDARGIQHILQDNHRNYRKGRFNDVLKPLLGQGIFLSENEMWLKQRRECAPVFANGNFPEMAEQMAAAAEAMIARWEPRIDKGEAIDLNQETMQFALDVIFRALFHEEKEDIAATLKSALGLLLNEAEQRIWALASLPQAIVLSLPKYTKALAFLDSIVADLIDRRRRNQSYPEDLLSRLTGSYGDSETDRAILRDQVMSFLLAGHETTANGLAWAFYETGKRPDIKHRMFREAEANFGNALPCYDALSEMHFTRQVFDEALRLYPPVWTFSREALENDVIPLDNGDSLEMRKGCTAMLCAYAVHRRDCYWDEPEAFDPDRFAPEAAAARPKFAYFPFGGGARLCLGFRFAQMEGVAALAMAAQRYNWTLVPGQTIEPKPVITLRPSQPIYFKMQKRNTAAKQNPEPSTAAGAEFCPFHIREARL